MRPEKDGERKHRLKASTQAKVKEFINEVEAEIKARIEKEREEEKKRVVALTYKIHLDGHEDIEYEFKRAPSACFSYGNGTAVSVFYNGKFQGLVDTRYDHEVMVDFDKWCRDYIMNEIDPEYKPDIYELIRR